MPVEPPGAAPQTLPFEAECVTCRYQSDENGLRGDGFDAGLIRLAEALDVRGVAELEKHLVAQRRRDLDLPHVVQRVGGIADVGCGDRVVTREQFGILVLPDALEIGADLRLLVGLVGEPDQRVAHVLVLDRRVAGRVADSLAVVIVGGIERIADALVHRDVAHRAEEPEPILHDRAAHVEIEVLHVLDEVAVFEALVDQVLRQVVRLPARRRPTEEPAALDDVAAVLRNHVHADAASRHFGRQRARLEHHLLRKGVVVVRLDVAVTHGAVHAHAVHLDARVAVVGAVRAHVGLFHALRTADVRSTQLHTGNDRADRLHVAGRRQRVNDVAIDHLRALCVLDVDQRRLAGHRDALFERTDTQFDVDGDGGIAGEFDAVTDERGEADSVNVIL